MTRGMGWRPDTPDIRDRRLSFPRGALATLPSSVDLRPGMPPVYDQGQLGSCTANAIAGAMQYARRKQHRRDYVPSRLFIYYNERVMEGTVNSDAGAMIRDGIKSVNTDGAVSEELWPYVESKFADKPTDECYADAPYDAAMKYARVGQAVDEMRTCLAAGFPFAFGFTVYESFESQIVASTGIMPMPSTSERAIGGHAVLACGYDDAEKMMLVRNSWSSGWGIAGYFKMKYDYIASNDLADDFWQIDLIGQRA